MLSKGCDEQEYTLYPGDSMWIPSNCKHKWQNNTSQMVKIFSVDIRRNRPMVDKRGKTG